MTIYDYKDCPAYQKVVGNPEYLKNEFILDWWTYKHDELLKNQISKLHWCWYWEIRDRILEITPKKVIENWRNKDPLCKKYAWYNILMYFAISRVESLKLNGTIREPEWKICPLCNDKFIESSLPFPLVKRLGINNIDFCSPCLRDSILFEGNENVSKDEILEYIRGLTSSIQRIPPQNYGEGVYDIYNFSTEQRLVVLKILKQKPALKLIKKVFGSWFKALIESGVLDDDAQQLSRGTRCLANDGHVCLSLGEKTIDDLLDSMGIKHEKEPKYPEGNYRADFKVNDSLIEYFGLKGQKEYDEKIKIKKKICKKNKIKLLSIYPKDLINTNTLENKILKL